MTYFEQEFISAINDEKIICYDATAYDRILYFIKNNIQINKLICNKSVFDDLKDYYYLGLPVKEIIKSNNSNGLCHSCALALSLLYDKFTIVTLNLSSYASYLNEMGISDAITFEHTVLLIDNNVIDTSFGIIADYETYQKIFRTNKVRTISSDEIKKTKPYQYLINHKYDVGVDFYSELVQGEDYQDYIKTIQEFLNLCTKYQSSNNKNIEYFYNSCIPFTSNFNVIKFWRSNMSIDTFADSKKRSKIKID